MPCRTFCFKPKGAVFKPIPIGVALFKVLEDGTEVGHKSQSAPLNYYHINQMMGQAVPEGMWAKYEHLLTRRLDNGLYYRVLAVDPDDDLYEYEKTHIVLATDAPKRRVRPYVSFFGQHYFADSYIDFQDVPEITLNSETLSAYYDGTTDSSLTITTDGTPVSYQYITAAEESLSMNKAKFNKRFGKNYSLTNKMVGEAKVIAEHRYNDVTFRTYKPVTIEILPNTTEDPIASFSDAGFSYSVSRLGNGKGWHFIVNLKDPTDQDDVIRKTMFFDLEEIPSETDLELSQKPTAWKDNFSGRYEMKNVGGDYYSVKTGESWDGVNPDVVQILSLDPLSGKFDEITTYGGRGQRTTMYIHFKDNFSKQ